MTEEAPSKPVAPVAVTRAETYSVIPSNTFRYRLGLGEIHLSFCAIDDVPGDSPRRVLEERVAITMSWPQMKGLAFLLKQLVDGAETEMGPIPMFVNAGFDIPIKEHALKTLKGLKVTSKPL
jgi:hypothetical protein